jgi:YD repeat-containing protein
MRLSKYLLHACFGTLACLFSFPAIGQNSIVTPSGPSVSALMNFNDIPVNPYTGVPDINIPIYHFPTHSKDVNVDLSVNYHPSGASNYSGVSEVGRGWSLMAGGAIARNVTDFPDKLNVAGSINDIYEFNFMGYSGKFVFDPSSPTTLPVIMLETSTLKVEYAYTSGAIDVDAFTIYDDKGYKYVFAKWDRDYISRLDPEYHSAYHNAWFLTEVSDNNGKLLVNISYSETLAPVSSTSTKIFNKINVIDIQGVGKAKFDFTYLGPSASTIDPFKLNAITITTPQDVIVKKFTFTGALSQISEFDATLTTSKDYKFFYAAGSSPGAGHPFYGLLTYGYDFSGYPAWKYCNYDDSGLFKFPTQPELAMYGSLQKIVLPTGGSILYDFESNTYSDDFYGSVMDYSMNPHNTLFEVLDDHDFDTSVSESWNFTVTGSSPKKLYFNYTNVPYYSEPEYQLDENPLPITYKIFSGSTEIHSVVRSYNAPECQGLGTLVELAPGSYTLKIVRAANVHATHTTGNVFVTNAYPNPAQENWMYGAGLRIKRIAYFDTNVSASYFADPTMYPSPAKEINYSYTRFDDPSKSSGMLLFGTYMQTDPDIIANSQVFYSNVRMWETGNNGFAKYTFLLPNVDNLWGVRQGCLSKEETFNNSGQLLTEVNNTYDFDNQPLPWDIQNINFGQDQGYINVTWAKLIGSVNTNYRSGVALTHAETFFYNSLNHQLASKTATNSFTGEILKTDYTYHTGNSTLSKNRISEIETIKTYRGAELLSNGKTIYSNTFSGNVSYLPQIIQAAKGANSLEDKMTVIQYDDYGNPLEAKMSNGTFTSYIWGYNQTQLIAKVENAPYGLIQPQVANLQTLSNGTNEGGLISALSTLRNSPGLADASVTTYTYKPLLGVSTVTDPKGDIQYCEYDAFGRLKTIKDKDGNIVSENKYNYRP